MNQFFYFSRFIKLFLQELNHSKKLYIGLAAGAFILKFSLSLVTSSQNWNFFFPLFVIIAFSAPHVLYPRTNDKIRGVSYAMLPVSVFEKLFSIILHCTVIIPSLFVIGYILGVFIYNMLNIGDMSYTLLRNAEDFYACVSVQCIGLLGCLFFKRQKFLKTIGFILLLFFIYVLFILFGFIHIVYSLNIPFEELPTTFSVSTSVKAVKNPIIEYAKEILSYIIFPAGIWLTAFFKMKEQEY